LAAIGAFRIVDARDLGSVDPRHGELVHLKEAGLIEIRSAQFRDGERTAVVTLTKDGKELLEKHQWPRQNEPRQEFYNGIAKPREASHDAQLYRAYERAAIRLQAAGARIRRVVIDYELKREYQRFLQANNRGNRYASGKPDRSAEEIQRWAREHELPMVRDRVQFPDVRIEYEGPDGRDRYEDIELTTEHYNSRQMGAKRSSGFTMHRGGSSHGRGSPFDPHAAEKVLR
jgi:DNA-binding PadR family transcriptional regulator